jgi:hypothetical protein
MNISREEYNRLYNKKSPIQEYFESDKDNSKILDVPGIIHDSCVSNIVEVMEKSIKGNATIRIPRNDDFFNLHIELISDKRYIDDKYIKNFELRSGGCTLCVDELKPGEMKHTKLANGKWSHVQEFRTGFVNPICEVSNEFHEFQFVINMKTDDCPYKFNIYKDRYFIKSSDLILLKSINTLYFTNSDISTLKEPIVAKCDFNKQQEDKSFLVTYNTIMFEVPDMKYTTGFNFKINTSQKNRDNDLCRIKDIQINTRMKVTLSNEIYTGTIVTSGSMCLGYGGEYEIPDGPYRGGGRSRKPSLFFKNPTAEPLSATVVVTLYNRNIRGVEVLPEETLEMKVYREKICVQMCGMTTEAIVKPQDEKDIAKSAFENLKDIVKHSSFNVVKVQSGIA